MQSRCLITTTLLIVATILLNVSGEQQTQNSAFELFLKISLQEFPGWIESNNLIPERPNPLEYDLSLNNSRFRLNCKIRDERVHIYARYNNPWNYYNASVNLEKGTMNLSFYTDDMVAFDGNYSANGSVIGGQIPLFGEGIYKTSLHNLVIENLNYEFRVTPQGYIVLSGDSLKYYNMVRIRPYGTGAFFEGLWDDDSGYALYLVVDLTEKYSARVREWFPEHPTASLLNQYFIQVFQVIKQFYNLNESFILIG